MVSDPARGEKKRRLELWDLLHREGGPRGMLPRRLAELGIHRGQQGIFTDHRHTRLLTVDGSAVTVSLLHTGTVYADDLGDEELIYHYPSTHRPLARDLGEILATKATHDFGLPLFVITRPSPNAPTRDVQLAWVQRWNDRDRVFLVAFGNAQPREKAVPTEDAPFVLLDNREARRALVNVRQGQQRFKYLLFERYGAECAVCGLDVQATLDAAHLRPKHERGSDDPRNGLVLCASHHRAFDAGLFALEPHTLRLRFRHGGPDAVALRITRTELGRLHRPPHPEAVMWLWRDWTGKQSSGSALHEAG